jgi:hypothetical protein
MPTQRTELNEVCDIIPHNTHWHERYVCKSMAKSLFLIPSMGGLNVNSHINMDPDSSDVKTRPSAMVMGEDCVDMWLGFFVLSNERVWWDSPDQIKTGWKEMWTETDTWNRYNRRLGPSRCSSGHVSFTWNCWVDPVHWCEIPAEERFWIEETVRRAILGERRSRKICELNIKVQPSLSFLVHLRMPRS